MRIEDGAQLKRNIDLYFLFNLHNTLERLKSFLNSQISLLQKSNDVAQRLKELQEQINQKLSAFGIMVSLTINTTKRVIKVEIYNKANRSLITTIPYFINLPSKEESYHG